MMSYATCTFYRSKHPDAKSGFCHHDAPTMIRNNYAQWPKVRVGDWCWQYKRQAAQPGK